MTIDVYVAVDRALTSAERDAILSTTRGTNLDGAHPADMLAIIADADPALAVTDEWPHGEEVAGLLPTWTTYGQRVQLVSAALVAATIINTGTVTIDASTPHPPVRQVTDLAVRAYGYLHQPVGDEHD